MSGELYNFLGQREILLENSGELFYFSENKTWDCKSHQLNWDAIPGRTVRSVCGPAYGRLSGRSNTAITYWIYGLFMALYREITVSYAVTSWAQ